MHDNRSEVPPGGMFRQRPTICVFKGSRFYLERNSYDTYRKVCIGIVEMFVDALFLHHVNHVRSLLALVPGQRPFFGKWLRVAAVKKSDVKKGLMSVPEVSTLMLEWKDSAESGVAKRGSRVRGKPGCYTAMNLMLE